MRLVRILLLLCVVGLAAAAGAAWWLYHMAASDLPDMTKLSDYSPPLATTVLARDGEVLGYFYREKRFLTPLSRMSPWVPKAFLAAEDAAFYSHPGVDIPGILRAAIKNLLAGGIVQGGSTITQQTVKAMLLSPERSFERKLKEMILAYRLERFLSKDEILTIYLNQIYLGAGVYGVEAAAREYFGVHASELTLAQAAMLAGLPKAPSRYSPLIAPERAQERQAYVLGRLVELGWITPQEYEAARAERLSYHPMPDPSWKVGAYALEEVRRQLFARFGEDMVLTGGLTVRTSIDRKHQAIAEEALRRGLIAVSKRHGWRGPVEHVPEANRTAWLGAHETESLTPGTRALGIVAGMDKAGAHIHLPRSRTGLVPAKDLGWIRKLDTGLPADTAKRLREAPLRPGDAVWVRVTGPAPNGVLPLTLEQDPGVEGALVSMDPRTGEVLALVGGYDFFRSQFNRATQAKRQPGSAFKPIVYSAALDNGFTAASVVLDAPVVLDDGSDKLWKPENYEGNFYGPTLLRTALVKSRNLVTIRVAQRIGVEKIIERARAMGITTELPPYLSMALGAIEVTPINLCQAYTTFARLGSTIPPRLVLEVLSPWGETLASDPLAPQEVMSPQTAYVMVSMLQGVVQEGTGTAAKVLGRPLAGKTGTTNNEQDAWFMGFSPYLLTGVWVGYDQVRPMGRHETGAQVALPIWIDYRRQVEPDYPPEDFAAPEGIVWATVDPTTGRPAAQGITLPFVNGTAPNATAEIPLDEPVGSEGEDLLKQIF
ncbi:MAG: PBP1A family penicillin-binding protein [Desulfomicrobiaceae bacterium]